MSGEFEINNKTIIRYDDKSTEMVYVIDALKNAVENVAGFILKEAPAKNRKNIISFVKDASVIQLEGYNLNINRNGIYVKYKTANGVFNAVQTIRQLIPTKDIISGKILIPSVQIKDSPMLSYRGYMMDVARHFFPISHLKKTIDMMAFYKLNVFHIHLSDDQGWRFESKKYPKLQEIAAWRSETQNSYHKDIPRTFDGIKHGGYYSQNELKELVQYAKERFIRIIPEIDIPGHSQAILAAYPQYGCIDSTYNVSTVWGVHDNILCPKEETFSFLQDIFDELIDVFPDKYIHIGGDEVPKRRWKESLFCQELIAKNNLKDEHGLQSYFIHRIEKYLNGKGRDIIGWDEILEGGLAPNATVMSWRGEKGGIEAAKQKHNVIMTPSEYMYVNFYNSPLKNKVEPLALSNVLTIEKVYDYSVFPKELSHDESKYIIGLQACLWTEYCKTVEHAESLTYPRLCAMAECAWTPQELKNYDNFYSRLVLNIKHFELWNINYSKLFLKNK